MNSSIFLTAWDVQNPTCPKTQSNNARSYSRMSRSHLSWISRADPVATKWTWLTSTHNHGICLTLWDMRFWGSSTPLTNYCWARWPKRDLSWFLRTRGSSSCSMMAASRIWKSRRIARPCWKRTSLGWTCEKCSPRARVCRSTWSTRSSSSFLTPTSKP